MNNIYVPSKVAKEKMRQDIIADDEPCYTIPESFQRLTDYIEKEFKSIRKSGASSFDIPEDEFEKQYMEKCSGSSKLFYKLNNIAANLKRYVEMRIKTSRFTKNNEGQAPSENEESVKITAKALNKLIKTIQSKFNSKSYAGAESFEDKVCFGKLSELETCVMDIKEGIKNNNKIKIQPGQSPNVIHKKNIVR